MNIRDLLVTISLLSTPLLTAIEAQADARRQAQIIHSRLTGVNPDSVLLDQLEALAVANQWKQLAEASINGPYGKGFYDTALSREFTISSNTAKDPNGPLTDMVTTIIGLIRDNGDIRDIMTTSALYLGPTATLGAYSDANNTHYLNLASAILDGTVSISNPAQVNNVGQLNNTLPNAGNIAGVLTTHGFAKAFFEAGTNRRVIEATYREFLCTPIDTIRDSNNPATNVARDVDRSPGGDPSLFNNSCIGCHGSMDAQRNAMAIYDYSDATGLIDTNNNFCQGSTVPPGPCTTDHKMNRNSQIFPGGYVTLNQFWTNPNAFANSPNVVMGWNGPTSGSDLASWGSMIAQSDRFAECAARRAFRIACKRTEVAGEKSTINQIKQRLVSSGFDFRDAVTDTFEIAAQCRAE